jgi:hypothetical protein
MMEVPDMTELMGAWEALHTALAGDPKTDPDSVVAFNAAKEDLVVAANDFCGRMSALNQAYPEMVWSIQGSPLLYVDDREEWEKTRDMCS